MTTNLPYDAVRGYVFRYLREMLSRNQHDRRKGQVNYLVEALKFREDGGAKDNTNDMETVFQVAHDLAIERIIQPGTLGGRHDPSSVSWPHFVITTHGEQVLTNSTDYLPYDPEGYLSRIETDCPNLDSIIRRYTGEALECLKRHCLLAGAVSIGCASERALLMLIDTFGDAVSSSDRSDYDKATKDWQISRKYRGFRPWIENDKNLPRGPAGLRDGVDHHLGGIFNLIRETRNDAGHPAGADIDQEHLRDNLIMFTRYLMFIYKLLDHYGHNTVQRA